MNIYDSTICYEDRIKYLINEMTISEKISQLMHDSPAIERLGIAKYNWWNEALHGVGRAGLATVFPQAIGLAATFNSQSIYSVANVISDEARAKYNEFNAMGDNNIYKGLTFWSPNINIFRDPRWGRGQETYGEDPFLTAQIAKKFVKGLQGDDDFYLKTVATPKHFYAHSGPEEGRHSFDSIISDYDKYNTYLYSFKKVVDEGAYSVMTAYNKVNGNPCVCTKEVIDKTLRNELKFNGVLVSDCGSVNDTHSFHKYTKNSEESAAESLKAGLDLECGSEYFHLYEAYESGKITIKDIDKSLYRVLKTRFKLGQFDKAVFNKYDYLSYEDVATKESEELNEKVAAESFVLLKNENILPISNYENKSFLIVGPNAASYEALLGNYSGTPSRYSTVLDAACNKLNNVKYVEGCHLFDDNLYSCGYEEDSFAEAIILAQKYDYVIFCGGLTAELEGEDGDAFNPINKSGDRINISLPATQKRLIKKLSEVNSNTILVNFSGSCVALDDEYEKCSAILQVWYPGAKGGDAIIKCIIGELHPTGRLPITFYSKNNILPSISDYRMENRTYKYLNEKPLFSFGYGIDYIDTNVEIAIEKNILVVNVENLSFFEGSTTIMIYDECKKAKYKYKLLYFEKIDLDINSKKSITINLAKLEYGEFVDIDTLDKCSGEHILHISNSGINESVKKDIKVQTKTMKYIVE